MALRPVENAWKRAARNAVNGFTMLGIIGLGANVVAVTSASLSPAYAAEVTAPKPPPGAQPISTRECRHILGTSSGVIGSYEGTLNPKFTGGLAKFFASPTVDPITNEKIDRSDDVHKILINGTWEAFTQPKTSDETKYILDVLKAINCLDFDALVPASNLKENGAVLSIARLLARSKEPIDLEAKGIHIFAPDKIAKAKVTLSPAAAIRPPGSVPGSGKPVAQNAIAGGPSR
jgi:hypothetical protein